MYYCAMSENVYVKKIIIDKKKCIGCAACAVLCPEVFSFDENKAVAVVNQKAVANADQDKIKSTVQACPSGALSILD